MSKTPGIVVKKLGQPVPDSNFIAEVKSGRPQPAQAKMPGRFSSLRGLVPARSVPSSRMTWKDSAGRRFFHSSFASFTGSLGEGTLAPVGRKDFQFCCSSSTPFMVVGGAACTCLAKSARPKALSNVRRSIVLLSGRNSGTEPELPSVVCYRSSGSVPEFQDAYPPLSRGGNDP